MFLPLGTAAVTYSTPKQLKIIITARQLPEDHNAQIDMLRQPLTFNPMVELCKFGCDRADLG